MVLIGYKTYVLTIQSSKSILYLYIFCIIEKLVDLSTNIVIIVDVSTIGGNYE